MTPPRAEQDHDGAGMPARRAALEALRRIEEDGAWSTRAVPDAIASLPDARDRRFASHLAYETVRWQGTLDWILATAVDRPLADVEPALLRILRLGLLQLWRSRVPARAAVSTAVALARSAVPRSRARGAAGFVNGVLRAVSRGLDGLPWPDPDTDPVSHLALTTGHPPWIAAERLAVEDPASARALLDADNEAPGLTLRAVQDRDALLAELRAAGIPAEPTRRAPEGVRAPGADPRRLAAVTEGRAVPQDEASMLVGRACRVRPGDRVLDLCAGPGGKTTHLAQLAGPGGSVVAVEKHPHRADLVREAGHRLGLDVDVRVGDARAVALPDAPDVVLVDAPCTGLGTGRRRPEVRWRRTDADADSLAALQQELALRAIEVVRPGGHVTYAVCTWTQAETVAVATAVEATAHRRLERVELEQLRPDRHATDGMFHVTWLVVG